eukprot:229627-Pelagomonas_calceolata.AAC.6
MHAPHVSRAMAALGVAAASKRMERHPARGQQVAPSAAEHSSVCAHASHVLLAVATLGVAAASKEWSGAQQEVSKRHRQMVNTLEDHDPSATDPAGELACMLAAGEARLAGLICGGCVYLLFKMPVRAALPGMNSTVNALVA